jgi:hypothetical protein
MSTTTPSSDEYVFELVLPDGRRVRRLGYGSDEKQAYAAREEAEARFPYFGVRLRKGERILDYRLARPTVPTDKQCRAMMRCPAVPVTARARIPA